VFSGAVSVRDDPLPEAAPLRSSVASEPGLPQDEEIAAALGAIGPDAKAALPELRKLLKHPELKVAATARDAIAKIEVRK
jgi:hypothetical protein